MAYASFQQCRQFVRSARQLHPSFQGGCINGFAVGRKIVQGKATSDLAITVFVNQKLSLRRLPFAMRIPQVFRLPDEGAPDGMVEFITDVQEASFHALEFVARERPAPSGISIGHAAITAGTLGGLVRDRDGGAAVILSNNHVLADTNDGGVGDSILQPGPADGGTDPADRIATLTRFVEIDFAPGAENRVDGAIAAPLDPASAQVVWNTREIGVETPVVMRSMGEADLGLAVQKTGRTTEHTEGFVNSLFATVQVKYGLFRNAVFVDQIIVSQPQGAPPFSDGGDSGSLVYDSENRLVGLLFAGSEGTAEAPATTILNPVGNVLGELNIELLEPGAFPSAEAGVTRRAGQARRLRARKSGARA